MLNYEEELPLAWRVLDGAAPPPEQRQAEANERLLQMALSAAAPHHEDDADTSAQMRRLEMKLDRVLDTLTLIAHMQKLIPPTRPVRLSAEGLEWQLVSGETCPAPGTAVGVSLHLERSSVQHLDLRATIASTAADAGGDWVSARFTGLSDTLEDALSRFVFTQHRRGIASAKAKS